MEERPLGESCAGRCINSDYGYRGDLELKE